jgi:hypothetical protein
MQRQDASAVQWEEQCPQAALHPVGVQWLVVAHLRATVPCVPVEALAIFPCDGERCRCLRLDRQLDRGRAAPAKGLLLGIHHLQG